MMATVQQRLAARQGHKTLWELAMTDGSSTYLVRYTNRRSRTSLLDNVRNHGDTVVALTGQEQLTFAKNSADGATMGNWRIYWTGRTERQAIAEGEHPYIGDLVAA